MADFGRPTEYTEKYIGMVSEYLDENQDEYDADTKRQIVKLPTVEGFANYIGVSKKTLYNWEKEHENFLHALDMIRQEQQKRLLNKGLSGEYNSTIAKLVLSANHGMREGADVTTNGKEMPTPILHGILRNDSTA